jgi:hypothetical protein
MSERSRTAWSCGAVVAVSLLVCRDVTFAQSRGVGSVGATVGAVGAGAHAASPATPVGAKIGDAPPPMVRLLDNERNPCLDGTSDCRLYWIAEDAADPEIVYDGQVMVQFPTELDVVMVPENDPNLFSCQLTRPVSWPDLVERGRTVAGLRDMRQVFQWAQQAVRPVGGDHVAPTRYRLVWCPAVSANGTRRDLKARGQSWRLTVVPRGSVIPTTPNPGR